MLNEEVERERAQLGFKEAALGAFEFLSDFALYPVEERVTLVRYESSGVFVNVYHGRSSYELGVEIGRLKEPDATLSIFAVVCWAGAEEAEDLGQRAMFQVGSRENVQQFVPRLATLVRQYAADLLRGDETAFRSIHEFQRKQWAAYEHEVRVGNLRTKAEVAWHAKDYARLVELFGSMRTDLTGVEAKKLAYAEQQLSTAAASVGSCAPSPKRQ